MNPRRDFFRKLLIGAAALPAVAKVVMEARPVMRQTALPVGWSSSLEILNGMHSRRMHEAICRHIATHDPCASLAHGRDGQPLYFSIAGDFGTRLFKRTQK